ncbi:MAG: hypothetical protein QOC63_1674 [Mycobacterium sp.]|nr:hypothetical protein [Mycobacterium sp.]
MPVAVNPKNGLTMPVNTNTNSGRERFMESDRAMPNSRS